MFKALEFTGGFPTLSASRLQGFDFLEPVVMG